MAGVITMRVMETDDIARALTIEEDSYPQPWTAAIFSDELAAPGRTYVVVEEDGEIIGYGGLMTVGDEAHVTTLTVDPVHRGHGHGTRLMLYLAEAAREGEARSLTLEVRLSNRPAQALYQRFGMVPVGVRKRYYGNEDALIMWVHDIDRSPFAERLREIREAL